MRGSSDSGGSGAGNSGISLVDLLSEPAIKKAMRSYAAQHPATVLPSAISIVALIVYLVFPPFLGPAWVLILFIVFGVFAVVTYAKRYIVGFDQLYEMISRQRIADLERQSEEEDELTRLRETLQTGFANLNSNEGLKALTQLDDVYDSFQDELMNKSIPDSMSLAQIPGLGKDTYRRGLSVLVDALRLMTAIHSPTNQRLEKELAEMENKIETLKGERRENAEKRIASRRELLDRVEELRLQADKLLLQCDSCEASLQMTRLDIAAINSDTAESSVSALTSTLQATINHAKEVQAELKLLGY